MNKLALCTLILLGGAASAAEPVKKMVFINETAIAKDAPPLFAPTASGKQPLLALVNIRSVNILKDAPSACGAEPNILCMSSWFRYELKIKQVLVGEETRKSVSALTVGHALPVIVEEGEYSPDVLAILAPDESDGQHRPKADYRLKRLVWPSYCLKDALWAYGLKSHEGDQTGCHRADTIRRASDRDEDEDASP